MFQVGQICRELGINTQTIYYYERIGLIPPLQRTKSGYRLFSPEDVEILRFILRVKDLGLTLDEIKQLLELKKGRSLTCQAVYHHLVQKINQINAKILQSQQLKTELTPLLKQCEINLNNPPDYECKVLN